MKRSIPFNVTLCPFIDAFCKKEINEAISARVEALTGMSKSLLVFSAILMSG